MANTKRLAKECIMLCMNVIKRRIEATADECDLLHLCSCMITLSEAYKNVQ